MVRIFIEAELAVGIAVDLPTDKAHHVRNVLRLEPGSKVTLFNQDGESYESSLTNVSRSVVSALPSRRVLSNAESPVITTLVQGISRGDRMDYTLQKAVELGVNHIIPVYTARSAGRLDKKRKIRKLEHWKRVVQHAAEQSGRNMVPKIDPIQELKENVMALVGLNAYVLNPLSKTPLSKQKPSDNKIAIIAGPEGGFDGNEIHQLSLRYGAVSVSLGPRTLRTETAAVCALSVIQALWGDLG
jgi:16S rRNA (uracil1498-N3)-methyltransferase